MKHCQSLRAGGLCGMKATHQVWRGSKGRGTKRYFCQRCLDAHMSTPAQREKIFTEKIN